MNLRVVIAEDEEPALAKLRRLLSAIPGVTIAGEARDGKSAIALLRELHPDAAFLDIKMPLADGLAVAHALPSPPKIVFVTAHANFAAAAFEAKAADYLLKPYTAERLQALVERLREQLKLERMAEWMRDGRQVGFESASGDDRRVALKMGQEIVFLAPAAIECVIAEGNYLHVLTGKQKFYVRGLLAGFESGLDDSTFFRTHRSSTVNLRHVASLSLQRREAFTTSGFRIPVSRVRMAELVSRLKSLHVNFLGER